ncbi:AAA family ATPase [Novipirellula artificiosorum]|uniref:ATP-dependent Clp protease ATP-binding subunit ClpL n=1 Tax=Novipirellula artificiosorum TaxID=2528016 RepID=A0A5C6DCC7_9BACT|nr:AAA family ATPase [Novipirellula artificiosorum]TWU34893.1 ATP-dependent Clp protease ATP-binding subunit ClpL [Novipirellula artificiosorum]
MFQQCLRFVFLAFLAWWILAYLAGWWWVLPWLVTAIALLNAVTAWLLRLHREWLVGACEYRFILAYIRLVCYLTGDDIPTVENAKTRRLLLHLRSDYRAAERIAKQLVRGHDNVITGMLESIYDHHQVRASRRKGALKEPLASVLLIGAEGIGKTYLSRVLAKLLYAQNGAHVFDCSRISVDSLIGTQASPGSLAKIAADSGLGLVCFERLESADAEVQSLLDIILRKGSITVPGEDEPVSFENSVVVITTTVGIESVLALDEKALGRSLWKESVIETLCRESAIGSRLVSAISEFYFCQTPSDEQIAEVAALLMIKECEDHDIRLVQVDAMILATQVAKWNDAIGYCMFPKRIQNLLRKPIVAISAQKQNNLSLVVSENHE